MTNHRKICGTAAAVFVLMCIAAISTPNLLRSRMAVNEASLIGRLRDATAGDVGKTQLSVNVGNANPEKKLIHNAELGLIVSDVHDAVDQIERLTESSHGEIDKVEITETDNGTFPATVVVRVPAFGLETALAAFKRVGLRTEREQVMVRDATREFYDNEAHMRNLKAEEQQYLAIIKQAHTVKDTLAASEKISDVRDRIERLQAQIQLMTHDIEMSVVTIALMQESDTRVFGFRWRPLYNAKTSARELLVGLGEWLDWIVSVLIKLPLILLWVATMGGILLVLWKIGRLIWLQTVKPKVGTQALMNAPDKVK